MTEKEFITITGPIEDKKVAFWTAFRIKAPHLFNTIATQKNRRPFYAKIPQKTRKNVMIYLVDKGVIARTDIDAGNQAKQYKFSCNRYGETKGTTLKFYNIFVAEQFFIEAGILNPDGSELEYEGKT